MADAYYHTLAAAKNRFQIDSDISLDLLYTPRNGIINPEIDSDAIWQHLEPCLEAACLILTS
ncbi:MAG: hypothetical protein R2874_08265 [Desulfobacterales bacterium]